MVAMGSVLILAASVTAQDLPKSAWDGVYTAEQASRGQVQYASWCAHCHGDDLNGADAPALTGSSFLRAYRSLDRLFKQIQNNMPADDVTAVEIQDKLDIMALVLQVNGFPSGPSELALDLEYLSSIQIASSNGPERASNGALVDVVGCLVEDGRNWKLRNATEPVAGTMNDPQADATAAATRPLGTLTVTLLDVFPRPQQHIGHTMLVKGLLIRSKDNVSLNVLHLGVVSTGCAP